MMTLLIAGAAFGSAGCKVGGAQAADPAAIERAEAWLALVDRGAYGASWDEAASLFKQAVTQGAWNQQVAAVRQPLGKVLERKLKSATPAKSLPGAPDGEYVVIQYQVRYENKASAVETITPMKDGERGWRVSGYFIK